MDTPGSLEYGGRGRPGHGVIRSLDVRSGHQMSEVARPRRRGPEVAQDRYSESGLREGRDRPAGHGHRQPPVIRTGGPGPGPLTGRPPPASRRPKLLVVNDVRGATCCPWRNRLVGPVGDASLCRSTASSHADRGCLLVDPRGAGCALRRGTASGCVVGVPGGAVPAGTAPRWLRWDEAGAPGRQANTAWTRPPR